MGAERSRAMAVLFAVVCSMWTAGLGLGLGLGLGSGKTFIVRVDGDLKPAVFPTPEHWYRSSLAAVKGMKEADAQEEASRAAGDALIHVYRTVFQGFSAKLTAEEAAEMEKAPGVLAMLEDKARQLQTTRSPQFLGLLRPNGGGLWAESKYGADLVIGVLDTGIWPERRSFSDRNMGPVPGHWKGACETGAGFPKTVCNRKLVGARFFARGYEAMSGSMNETAEFRSARDSDGHGTHTASTAAGRYVYRASMLGYARGIAKGIAPKARIAAYKVCWVSGCFDSDILAAFDQAVADGVNVISLSVGGGVVPYYLDSIALGAFGAMEKGIFVSASAGNEGPGDLSVTNVAPWITTVGAGTLDRDFPAYVKLGNGRVVRGVSLYSGRGLNPGGLVPLIYAGDAAAMENGSGSYSSSLCMEGSLNPRAVRGKIVLCERGNNPRVAKGAVVKQAGGVGMILANSASDGEGLVADAHVLPATAVGASAGDLIRQYILSAKNPTATITFRGTLLGVKPAPVVASFSARGPNPETPEILKPDVIAPGVNILAAWTEAVGPTGLASDRRRTEFNIISGTSMACPHVSGLAALLKGAHPGWSPAAIRSALMTTAYVQDNKAQTMIDEATGNASTPFDFGAGHVDPQRAMDPGLIYDLGVEDYVEFLCSLKYSEKAIRVVTRTPVKCPARRGHPGNLNYPSFSAVFDQTKSSKLSTFFIRTVTNVGPRVSTYRAKVVAPKGVEVLVKPRKLSFTHRGQKLRYMLTVRAKPVNLLPGNSDTVSGFLSWTDGARVVQSPIVVTRQEPY